MEDKMIQQFDRAIEQAMNNYTEAPPFGMWNRISAELGEPAPSAAPNNAIPSWINTGSVVGFLSGALLIGGLVVGNLLYNNNPIAFSEYNKTVSAPLAVTPSIKEEEDKVVQAALSFAAPAVKLRAPKTITIESTEASTAEQVIDKTEATNYTAAATSEIVATEARERNFYFPPVDIETGTAPQIQPAQVEAALPQMQHTTIYSEAGLKTEEKVKSASTSKDQRLKFRPKKKKSHSYGHINRSKSKNR